LSDAYLIYNFLGCLTPDEQEATFEKIKKHRQLQKELEELKPYIMKNPRTKLLVKTKVDATEMEHWVKNLMKQFQSDEIHEDYIQLIIQLAKETKKELEVAGKAEELEEKESQNEKVGHKSKIFLYLMLMIGSIVGITMFSNFITTTTIPEFHMSINFFWFLSPCIYGFVILISGYCIIAIARNIFYTQRTSSRFRALENFTWQFLVILLLTMPMILFLFAPYSFTSDAAPFSFLRTSFLLALSLFICLAASFVGGLLLALETREFRDAYFTSFSRSLGPVEINIEGDIFHQSYVSYASSYQVLGVKGLLEITPVRHFNNIFLNLVSSIPLFLICLIVIVTGELNHLVLGPFVSWGFLVASGTIISIHLIRFFREGNHFHSVLNGLTEYYMYQYDQTYKSAMTNPNVNNIAQMDHWHKKLDLINHFSRWPLGSAGKLVAIFTFLIEILILLLL
jgi:phosphate/sulfate permease